MNKIDGRGNGNRVRCEKIKILKLPFHTKTIHSFENSTEISSTKRLRCVFPLLNGHGNRNEEKEKQTTLALVRKAEWLLLLWVRSVAIKTITDFNRPKWHE